MREDDSNWFSRWEDQLPSPDELMPLSQTLITPHLALAFDIPNPGNYNNAPQTPPPPTPQNTSPLTPTNPNSSEFDNSAELGGSGGDEPARTLKRPRLVWTPQLHKRFVDAVAHLGIKNAVPKTIMQLMSVDGLTRENVASHLQKYRLYLKRMQGFSSGGGGGGNNGSSDPATDRLFASQPVPAHFLHPGRSNSDHFMPFVATPNPGGSIWVSPHPQLQYQRPVGQFGSPPNNGQFEHAFMGRGVAQGVVQRVGGGSLHSSGTGGYMEDLEGGRKVLTLFPTGDD